ncbi:MAG: Rieske 2Fe-2S domain-containing protein [Chloroflexi bacterium]|nr:Rieske 2Fe-2S domain-containing protein [Chloroflexota bacterium]
MLSASDNELLTRVGAGTPMGSLLRQYWIPFLFSWEIEAGGAPTRVRLMGEDLVAFRDTHGAAGLVAERCAHRGASLYFGRNEDGGLACIYHGWKYDGSGRCMEMPSEPDASDFKDKVRIVSYPCVERGGIVWTFMGKPEGAPPPLPALEWLDLPEDHIVASKRVQPSNWLQAIEGEIDQSHVSFVHSRLELAKETRQGTGRGFVDRIRKLDRHPRFEVVETESGMCIGAGRNAPDGMEYWRVTQHLMPFHIMTGPYGEDPMRNWRAWIPIDDTNVFVIGLSFHPLRPFTGEEREQLATRSGVWTVSPEMRAPKTSAPFGAWRVRPGLDNDFFQDRTLQKTELYSGITEFWAQDSAPQLTMGPIFDRTQEHLGTSDRGIIAVRRKLARTVRALAERGELPPEPSVPDVYRVRSDAMLLRPDQHWFEATAERRKVVAGSNPDCP